MLIPVLIIILLLLVNAFFVVAEFAIVGVQRSAIDARASRNDRLAKLVLAVLDDPHLNKALGLPQNSRSFGPYQRRR